MLVVTPSIECDLQPIVAVAYIQALRDIRRARRILLCIRFLLCHIAHIVIVAHPRIGTHIPMSGCVDSGIEGDTTVHIPVTVDILRS